MVDPQDVCAALRSYRIRGRIKQQIIADILGVAQSQISRWESGRDTPRPHNVEAIKSLVWGQRSAELQSLITFVTGSSGALVLLDAEDRPLAVSRALRPSDSPWHRFGWAFQPERNPCAAVIEGDLRRIAAQAWEAVTVELSVPFVNDGATWVATARRTLHAIGGRMVSLAEVGFAPADEAGARASLRRVELTE